MGGGGPIDGVRLTLMVNETSFHALPMAINQVRFPQQSRVGVWPRSSRRVHGSILFVLYLFQQMLPLITLGLSRLMQASNALLRLVSGRDAGITVRSHPLPALPFENSRQIETSAGNLLLVLLIMLAMAGMSASFAVFLVKEATSGSKLVQLVAGAAGILLLRYHAWIWVKLF